MDILQFLSTFMTADGVSVGLQGVIVLMILWIRSDITHIRGDITRLNKRVDDVNNRIDGVNNRIDGLVVQVGGSNRVLMP